MLELNNIQLDVQGCRQIENLLDWDKHGTCATRVA